METLLSTIGQLIARGGKHQAALIALIASVTRTPDAARRPGVGIVCALCEDPALRDQHERLAALLLELLAAPSPPKVAEKPKHSQAATAMAVAAPDKQSLPPFISDFWEQVRNRILPQGPVPPACAEAGTINPACVYRTGRKKPAHTILTGVSGAAVCLCAPRLYDADTGKWPDDQIQGLSMGAGKPFPSDLILILPVVNASRHAEAARQWAAAAEVRALQLLGTIVPATFLFQKVAVRVVDVDSAVFLAYQRAPETVRFAPCEPPRMFQPIAETTVLRTRAGAAASASMSASAPKRVHVADPPEDPADGSPVV